MEMSGYLVCRFLNPENATMINCTLFSKLKQQSLTHSNSTEIFYYSHPEVRPVRKTKAYCTEQLLSSKLLLLKLLLVNTHDAMSSDC